MALQYDDLSIDDLLADALVGAMMLADHVDPNELRVSLGSVASRIAFSASRAVAPMEAARPDGPMIPASGSIFYRGSVDAERSDVWERQGSMRALLGSKPRIEICGPSVCW